MCTFKAITKSFTCLKQAYIFIYTPPPPCYIPRLPSLTHCVISCDHCSFNSLAQNSVIPCCSLQGTTEVYTQHYITDASMLVYSTHCLFNKAWEYIGKSCKMMVSVSLANTLIYCMCRCAHILILGCVAI